MTTTKERVGRKLEGYLFRSHNKHGKKLGECWNELEDIMNEFDMDEVS